MPDQPTPPAAAPMVQPQPLPTRVSLNLVTAQAPGLPTQHLLRWDITTPAGVTVFFSDKAFSQQLLQMLEGQLQQWPAQLVVPQPDVAGIRRELERNGNRSGG